MSATDGIRYAWRRYGTLVWLATMGLMIAAVAKRLVHVLLDPTVPNDLQLYQHLIHAWFRGEPVYAEFVGAVHPPALYLLLWPIYGWLPQGPTRWLFVVTSALALVGLVVLVLREIRPVTARKAAFVAGLLVASSPTAVTIAAGQATLHILLATLGGILLLVRKPPTVGRDAAAAALLLFALAKPNLTAPFFWGLLFSRGTTRPLVLVAVGYIAATAAAITLHGGGIDALHEDLIAWFHRTGRIGVSVSGYGNVHVWLGALGLRSWIFPASMLLFALHGVWSWRHREAEAWTLIGVAAIVARIWTYHRVYDDMLLMFPLVALYRLARSAPPGTSIDLCAGLLFGLGTAALLVPISPLVAHAEWALVAIWLLQLGFLMRHAQPATGRGDR